LPLFIYFSTSDPEWVLSCATITSPDPFELAPHLAGFVAVP
jgi:hypothetical protein